MENKKHTTTSFKFWAQIHVWVCAYSLFALLAKRRMATFWLSHLWSIHHCLVLRNSWYGQHFSYLLVQLAAVLLSIILSHTADLCHGTPKGVGSVRTEKLPTIKLEIGKGGSAACLIGWHITTLAKCRKELRSGQLWLVAPCLSFDYASFFPLHLTQLLQNC